jgi:2-phosphoglycerate kinase
MAAHLATRLNITRTQSTDMLREVLRTLRSPEKNPELHYSSFEAWRALDDSPDRGDMPARIEEGYNRQADEVELAAQALLERSQHEQFSMIIEGVHIRPSMIQRLTLDPDVIVVPILLTVSRKKTLKRFFKGRSLVTSRRGSKHYLDNFDAIWHLQSALTVDAKTSAVATIVNDEEEESTSVRVFSLIAAAVADHVLPDQSE